MKFIKNSMKHNKNFKNSLLVFVIVLASFVPTGFCSINPALVKAVEATPDPNSAEAMNNVLITDYQISPESIDNSAGKDDHIKGSLKLKNPHAYQVNNIYIQAELLKENTELDDQLHGHIILRENISGYINLKPNQEISQNIDLKVGTNLISSNYFVTISVYDQTSMKIASQSKMISIKGDGTLLAIDVESAFVQKGTVKQKAMTGPVVSAADKATFLMTIQNRSDKVTTYKPKMEVYSRGEFPEFKAYKVIEFDSSTINAKESKDITLNIPNVEKPESYLAKVYLTGSKGEVASSVVYYRFVIAGEGGKILASRVTSFRNWSKQVLSLRNSLIGPADASVLENAKIKTTVLKGNKEIATSEKQIAKLSTTQIDILDEIKVSQTPFLPSKQLTVKMELIGSNNNVLHTVTIPVPKTRMPLMQISILIVALLAILLTLGKIYLWPWWVKRQKVGGI